MKISGIEITASTVQKKLISSTRDMTASSGNVAYTGVGFTPNLIIAYCMLANGTALSFAVYDGTTTLDFIDVSGGGTGANVWSTAGNFIYLTPAAGKIQEASVLSMDADGFTLSWTKTGSPDAGSAALYFLCLRV